MNGNYLFNQTIARQRIQERLREAETHRQVVEARKTAGVEQGAESNRWRLRRWLRIPHLTFSWRKSQASR